MRESSVGKCGLNYGFFSYENINLVSWLKKRRHKMINSSNAKMNWWFVVFFVCFTFWVGVLTVQAKEEGSFTGKIMIGVAEPMKFSWGKNAWAGAQLAAEEINASGGVSIRGVKHKIELINADSNDYFSVVDPVSTVKRLISVNKINFLIAGARTEAILAQQEVMADERLIFIMTGGGAPELHTRLAKNYDRYKYFFNMREIAPYQSKDYMAIVDLTATKIRETLGISRPKVALVMEKVKWPEFLIEDAQKAFPKMNLEIVGTWRPSAVASDLTSELTAIKAAEAQIIYQVFTGPAGVILNKQVGELQIPAIVVGCNTEAGGMGTRYWDETMGMCEYEVNNATGNVNITKKTQPAYDKLSKMVGKGFFVTAYSVYDAVYVLKEAIERAGTIESDAVVTELEKTNSIGAMGKIAFYPKDHKYPHNIAWGPGYITETFFQWQSGKMALVYPAGHVPASAIEAGSGWEKFKHEGTVDLKLPPRMIQYYKK
jgi:branched-chain amino acid transport system substrate-binding protein